jgi:hypothetical protein
MAEEGNETKLPCMTVEVTDESIVLSSTVVLAGPLELIMKNTGSAVHELVLQGPAEADSGPPGPGGSKTLRGRTRAGDRQLFSIRNGQPETGLETSVKVQ